MDTVRVKCDRCGEMVDGIVDKHITGGFYDVETGTWSKFAQFGEKRVCDSCMHASEAYRQVYGAR